MYLHINIAYKYFYALALPAEHSSLLLTLYSSWTALTQRGLSQEPALPSMIPEHNSC